MPISCMFVKAVATQGLTNSACLILVVMSLTKDSPGPDTVATGLWPCLPYIE